MPLTPWIGSGLISLKFLFRPSASSTYKKNQSTFGLKQKVPANVAGTFIWGARGHQLTLRQLSGQVRVTTSCLGKQDAVDQEDGAVRYLHVGENGFDLTVNGYRFATY